MELHSLRDKGPLKLIKVKNRKHPAMERVIGTFESYFTRRFSAASLPLFETMSNVTLAPSRKSLSPALSTAEMWTNSSLPPPSFWL